MWGLISGHSVLVPLIYGAVLVPVPNQLNTLEKSQERGFQFFPQTPSAVVIFLWCLRPIQGLSEDTGKVHPAFCPGSSGKVWEVGMVNSGSGKIKV